MNLKEWHKSDDIFNPKLFKFMMLLPEEVEQKSEQFVKKVSSEIEEITVNKTKKVHVNDLVGNLVESFLSKGGAAKGAHVVSQHKGVKKVFNKLLLEHKEINGNAVHLHHNSEKIGKLRTKDIFDCFNKKNSDLSVTLSKKDNQITINFKDFSKTFSDKKDFENVEKFLKEVCYLVEYSKVQKNDFAKNLMVYHMESLDKIKNIEGGEKYQDLLKNGLEAFKRNVEKAYGKDNTKMMISKFIQSKSKSSKYEKHLNQRVLEGKTAHVSKGSPKNTAYADEVAKTIKYVWSIVLIFIFLYVGIYIYRIEVFKDSLVYSKFLSVRKK